MARLAPVKRLFEIDYADLSPDSARLAALCEVLGERWTPELNAVFEVKHGF
jgi:hypothetical protein